MAAALSVSLIGKGIIAGLNFESLNARMVIWNIALITFSWMMQLYVCKHINKDAQGKVVNSFLFTALLLVTANAIILGHRFYVNAVDENLAAGYFLVLVICASLYGASAGIRSLNRCAVVIIWILLGAAAVLLIGLFPNIRFSNIRLSVTEAEKIFATGYSYFCLPVELAYASICCRYSKCTWYLKPLVSFITANAGIAFLGELVLGEMSTKSKNVLIELAQACSISVAENNVPLFCAVYMLALFFEISLYMNFLTRICPHRVIIVVLILSSIFTVWMYPKQTRIIINLLVVSAMVTAVISTKVKRKKI